jgi:hypothetical protein
MTSALTPVLLCEARTNNGSGPCTGMTVNVPTPTSSPLVPVVVGAAAGAAAYYAAQVFGASTWTKIAAAAALALGGVGVAEEVSRQEVIRGVVRQQAAGVCFGQSKWFQDQISHSNGNLSNPSDALLLQCGFLSTEIPTVRAQMAAAQAAATAANVAQNQSNEKTFGEVAGAILAAFSL